MLASVHQLSTAASQMLSHTLRALQNSSSRKRSHIRLSRLHLSSHPVPPRTGVLLLHTRRSGALCRRLPAPAIVSEALNSLA